MASLKLLYCSKETTNQTCMKIIFVIFLYSFPAQHTAFSLKFKFLQRIERGFQNTKPQSASVKITFFFGKYLYKTNSQEWDTHMPPILKCSSSLPPVTMTMLLPPTDTGNQLLMGRLPENTLLAYFHLH